MSDLPKRLEPKTFTLYTSEKARNAEIDRIVEYAHEAPKDRVVTVKFREGEESRKEVANKLYQVIMGQISSQIKQRPDRDDANDYDVSVIAGKMKYHILLPLKKIMAAEYDDEKMRDDYEFERELCDMVLASKNIKPCDLYKAYDRAIRSKTLNTKPFARYLNEVIDRSAMQGFSIRLNASEQSRALGDEATQRRAA